MDTKYDLPRLKNKWNSNPSALDQVFTFNRCFREGFMLPLELSKPAQTWGQREEIKAKQGNSRETPMASNKEKEDKNLLQY